MTLRETTPSPRAAVLQAILVALVLACVPTAAHAAEQRYLPMRVGAGTATFAVGDLAGRKIVRARLTTGGRSMIVAPAKVRRAAAGSGLLRLSLPSSWGRRVDRTRMMLRVVTRSAAAPVQAPVVPPVLAPIPLPALGAVALPALPPVALPIAPPPLTVPPVVTPPPSSGSVLWRADAELPIASEWASSSSIPLAAAPPSPDPSRIAQSAFSAQGQHSYRVEMRSGDDSFGARAELGEAMPARAGFEDRLFEPGQERWIALQYYLPADWPADDRWQTILQLKPMSGGGGGPSIGLDAGHNSLKIYGNSNAWGSTAGNIYDGSGSLPGKAYPLTRGHWIKLTFHVVFSADPAVGSLEVFGDLADGNGMRTLASLHPRATMKYLNGAMDPAHLRVGIYRDPAITATANLFVDGITVATTRAAAEASAFGG
jgi:hypothetical protein